MYNFILPDYKGKSIVNLMSSIANNFGKKHKYKELDYLSSSELEKFKNIVLIVIDGLGYNYLVRHNDSFLFNNLRSSITSTFLSTTACANTVFSVGYPAQQHAITAWNVNLKEVGAIVTVLPFHTRYKSECLTKYNFDINQIMDIEPFHKGFNAKCFTLIDKKFVDSSFTRYISQGTNIIPISSYKNAFVKLKKLIKRKSSNRRFIHTYLPEFDSLIHKNGVKSKVVEDLFFDLDKRVRKLVNAIKGTNTRVIVVSDHGLIDCPKKSIIWVEDIKGMKECLTIPLTGESRVRNCYVRPSKVKDFEKIVKNKLSKYCWCFKGEKLIKDNLYGLGKPNKRLFDRIGDYVLIMKKNYALKDKLSNHKKTDKPLLAKHGGVSSDEMFIPLILIDSN